MMTAKDSGFQGTAKGGTVSALKISLLVRLAVVSWRGKTHEFGMDFKIFTDRPCHWN
jgi:hypothetical protein